jgi:Tfp pilus assembly protein PilV
VIGKERRAQSGFTLIEVAVAMLIGIVAIAAIAKLGESNIRQRATSDANASAMNLAVQQLETLKAITAPNADPNLVAGTHSISSLDDTGNVAVGGRYTVTWEVLDGVPYTGAKQITVTVTHSTAENVRAQIVTYYKTS